MENWLNSQHPTIQTGYIMKTAVLLFITTLLIPGSLWGAEDILIADFEGADFGGWKVEGDAFSDGPANKDRHTTYHCMTR
jgi:hypothetical protein